MGNAVSPCFHQISSKSCVKLIFYEGSTKILNGKHIAGEIMFESPDKMVCHADSFFIGQPIPTLAIDDELMPGQTYFVLPIDRFACSVLSTSSLAALTSSPKPASINFNGESRPFKYIKGANGRVLIQVMPEFIAGLILSGKEDIGSTSPCSNNKLLCSTPELKKQYDLLVGSRDQVWSPKLEPISEYNIRFSPCRFIGLAWKQTEKTSQ